MKKILKDKERLKELIRYGIFGLGTSLVNILVYRFLLSFLDYRISNLIAIFVSKAFAYITNKRFVFRSHCENGRELALEIGRFILARGATGLLDYFGLMVAVEVFGFNRVYSKYVIQIIVILLNYVLGKKAVFIDKNIEQESDEKLS